MLKLIDFAEESTPRLTADHYDSEDEDLLVAAFTVNIKELYKSPDHFYRIQKMKKDAVLLSLLK